MGKKAERSRVSGEKSSMWAEKPRMLVFAEARYAHDICALFAQRGFTTSVAGSLGALDLFLLEEAATPLAVAIIDFRHRSAHAALQSLDTWTYRAAIIGVVDEGAMAMVPERLDAAFERPVDRARMFVRALQLVAELKKGYQSRKLTGIVGVVRGNALFHAVACRLHVAISPINASAVLELILREVGTDPSRVQSSDVNAIIGSGRLAEALEPFGDSLAIRAAIAQVAALVRDSLSMTP